MPHVSHGSRWSLPSPCEGSSAPKGCDPDWAGMRSSLCFKRLGVYKGALVVVPRLLLGFGWMVVGALVSVKAAVEAMA